MKSLITGLVIVCCVFTLVVFGIDFASVASPSEWDLSEVGRDTIIAVSEEPLTVSEVDWWGHFSAHWHNRLVHIPLVLIWFAALLSLMGLRKAPVEYEQKVLGLILGLSTVLLYVAAFMGQRQAGSMPVTMTNLTFWHQYSGWGFTIALTLITFWHFRAKPALSAGWRATLLCLLAVWGGWMGALGGILSAS